MSIIRVLLCVSTLIVSSAIVFHSMTASRLRSQSSNSATGGVVSGRVLDANGQPISNVMVLAERVGVISLSWPSTYTNRDGEFLLEDLKPGLYTLHTRKEEDDYPRTEFSFYEAYEGAEPQVNVSEQQTTQNVMIQLGPKAAVLVGRVVDAVTNLPLRHADITVRRVDKPERFLRSGLSLPVEKGEFRLLVPSLPFTMKASETGYEDWYYKVPGEGGRASALLLASSSTKSLLVALHPRRRGN